MGFRASKNHWIFTKSCLRCSPTIREGKWGAYKVQAYLIDKVSGRLQGRVLKRSLPRKLFKTMDLELPFIEAFLPSYWPHSAGYTRTFLHPYCPQHQSKGNTTSQMNIRYNIFTAPMLSRFCLAKWKRCCRCDM